MPQSSCFSLWQEAETQMLSWWGNHPTDCFTQIAFTNGESLIKTMGQWPDFF